MGEKFKQGWSTIPSILTKQTTISHLRQLTTKRPQHYYVRNSGSVFGQAQKCGRVKPVIVY
jgi:hypothetical protein